MPNGHKLRISLALVIFAGALHLDRAQAAEPATAAPCDSYALGYAAGFCAATGQISTAVSYTCNADGTANIEKVYCINPT